MKITRILVALLLLTGCASGELLPKPLPEIDIVVHIRDSEPLRDEYRALGGKVPRIFGFAMIDRDPCEVWILTTATIADLAHEVEHCERGFNHD